MWRNQTCAGYNFLLDCLKDLDKQFGCKKDSDCSQRHVICWAPFVFSSPGAFKGSSASDTVTLIARWNVHVRAAFLNLWECVRQPFDCVARQAWGADCRFVLCTDVARWHPFSQLRMRVNALPSGSQHLNDYNSEQPTWEERLGISWHQPTRVLWPIHIQTCQNSLIGCDYCTVRVTFRHQLSGRKLTHVLFSKCRHLYATGDFSGPW